MIFYRIADSEHLIPFWMLFIVFINHVIFQIEKWVHWIQHFLTTITTLHSHLTQVNPVPHLKFGSSHLSFLFVLSCLFQPHVSYKM